MTTNHKNTQDLEQKRRDRISKNLDAHVKNRATQLEEINRIIEILQANRDHIGALGIVVMSYEDTCLVLPDEQDVTDGFTQRVCASHLFLRALADHAKGLTDTTSNNPFEPNIMSALFGGLQD